MIRASGTEPLIRVTI
ncbi:MAG: hypothetical protein LBE70_01840 [Nitrososphaerota archaeon]|nr:hypothetical protein [Nitrososphaerota archaeon]